MFVNDLPMLADVTGDGRADLVKFARGGGYQFALPSTGSSFGPYALWSAGQCHLGDYCFLADITGDRKADAVTFKP